MIATKVTRPAIERDIRATLRMIPGFFKEIPDEALQHE